MKSRIILFTIIALLSLTTGCLNKPGKNASKGEDTQTDTTTVADTGFTGIKQYFSGKRIVKEVTFKNSIRQGLMKTYYANGLLYQTFWYENGLRQDTARWYFEDGRVFRTTPFRDDSVNGIQTQFYRTGVVRAKLEYVNGLRTTFLEEFESGGKKITAYPDLVFKIQDNYKQNGTIKITLEITDKTKVATYYRGELIDGLFNPKKYVKINNSEKTGSLTLRKTGNTDKDYVGVIAEIPTSIGNKQLVYKKIDLPYNDLK